LRITQLRWNEETAEHIWVKHQVRPDEAEQVVFRPNKLVFRARDGRHIILGQTEAGRYLLAVVENLSKGACELVTARAMTKRERRRYLKQKL
jgi:hypothetical protein